MKTVDEFDAEIAELRDRLEVLEKERKRAIVPTEPSYSVLSVNITWNEGGKEYRYILLKTAPNTWHITGGNTRKTFTWEELYRWLMACYRRSPVEAMHFDHWKAPVLPQYSKY